MKKLLLVLLLVPLVSSAQTKESIDINSYKYIVLKDVSIRWFGEQDDFYTPSVKKNLGKSLRKAGYAFITNPITAETYNKLPKIDLQFYDDVKEVIDDPDLALYLTEEAIIDIGLAYKGGGWNVESKLTDFKGNIVMSWKTPEKTPSKSLKKAVVNSVKGLTSYNYKYNSSLRELRYKKDLARSSNNIEYNLTSEESIRNYFDKKEVELIEGIWDYSGPDNENFRLAIIKDGYKFTGTVIDNSGRFLSGQFKANFETAASSEILTINWLTANRTNIKTIGIVKNNALIEFDLDGKKILYRIYPKLDKTKKRFKTGDWAGNGSGIIISKSGYIITNHHVIEDADKIEVEFILDGEVQKFNAEVVQVDKVNDLAIIKIVDVNFDGVGELPYNFKTRSSDVGTKVYAFGYPMALSLMGKEIKVTDGMISSKTGFDGNITTYQITAPIQGGNSGGPLFDKKGNLIGINSSGLRSDVADNVAYSIKTSYILNLIDILPKSIELPSNTKLESLPLTKQIKEISKYVVLIKVK